MFKSVFLDAHKQKREYKEAQEVPYRRKQLSKTQKQMRKQILLMPERVKEMAKLIEQSIEQIQKCLIKKQ